MVEGLKEDGPERTAFLEKCYLSGVTEEDVWLMDMLHLQRIEEIDKVIDQHFELIQQFILQAKTAKRDSLIEKAQSKQAVEKNYRIKKANEEFDNDPELRFEEYDQLLKVKKLEKHNDELFKFDREEHEKPTMIRIQSGYAQSYFIFDSERFKIAKEIFYNLKEQN